MSQLKALLTDLYQLTMLYGYWLAGRHEEEASFDLFFRKHPFGGEFTIFAGLEDVITYLEAFKFDDDDIAYLKSVMPHWRPEFFDWLKKLDCSNLRVDAIDEGKLVFPSVPLLRASGHLGIAQLVETAFLYMVNFPSLITTQAARLRLAAGFDKECLEFGIRRAQDAMRASKYAYMGGFDGTSNVLAGQRYGIKVRGTHAHSWVMSFTSLAQLPNRMMPDAKGEIRDFVESVEYFRAIYAGEGQQTNSGELAAFTQYAMAYPDTFLALVDTYDTLKSGAPNFSFVARALNSFGYKALGVRLDSGDLAYLSTRIREVFDQVPCLAGCKIVASNDLDEGKLLSFKTQKHAIDAYGIGTALVTCADQPALGGVYKLSKINGDPRMKFSQVPEKNTIPGVKIPYRLYGHDGKPIIDLMTGEEESSPQIGEKTHCRHPFNPSKRAIVVPTSVEPLHRCAWNGSRIRPSASLADRRELVISQLQGMPEDMSRTENPRPYKVAVSEKLYQEIQTLRDTEVPVEILS
ncbi:nicotinate phosphoribosyltransferase [Candidatus Falkowbacteria bacterium]|nr:nicotinate phosphoribosyltransferase [Candidatus Falkowbacteria bacterium]